MHHKRSLKKNLFYVALAGCIATLAFEPFDYPVFLIPAFYILLRKIYNAPIKDAFVKGMVFGFFHFLTSLYWIAIALTSNVGDFKWLIPFAVVFIPGILSIYIGCACAIASLFSKNRILFIVAFTIIWAITEIVRGYYPLPFPWNFMGYTLLNKPYGMSLIPFLGLSICSLLVVFLAAIVFSKNLNLIIITYLATALAVIAVPDRHVKMEFWDESVRIVQPNLFEHHLGNQEQQKKTLDTLAWMSNKRIEKTNVKAVIWPEAAYPYLLQGKAEELKLISNILENDAYLITGADRINEQKQLYNSLVAVDSKGNVISTYDKRILVPFGEYVPFSEMFKFDKIAYGMYQFTPGEPYSGPSNQDNSVVLKYYPLICYEVIFPIKEDLGNYEWILNITNDAWYGNSSGPYQHFVMARFKAVEYGIPIIRVANTGISAIVSPLGDVLQKLSFDKDGFIDVRIPKKLKQNNAFIRGNQNILLMSGFLICLILNFALHINKFKGRLQK
ncbi:MAG: lnt [Candidatus Midichloriaceae bacterium]|jgi:apolipoprotein N-acyltransferase|nr:lnt [Candidatus Midichloriaceae bacterium]